MAKLHPRRRQPKDPDNSVVGKLTQGQNDAT